MLTREEIQALQPGHETDVAVAVDVMGWKVDPEESKRCDVAVVEWVEDGQQVWRWFKPSTDISAAIEAAEKFKTYQITKSDTGFSHSYFKYRVIVGKNGNVAYADSAPEAICKAALIALMEGQAHETN